MKQIIYIDVLIFLNIIITFLLLLGVSRLLRLSVTPLRYAVGSVLGGISSLVILAPETGFILSVLIKIAFSLIIVMAVYNCRSIKAAAKATGYFFAVSFIFAGMMMFASSLPGINIVSYRNGVAYINLSFFSLVGACVVCYVVTCILGRVTAHRAAGEIYFDIEITDDGKQISSKALLDTGNSLSDPFTGESVIIGDIETLGSILPTNIKTYLEKGIAEHGIRLIPCRTVSAQSLLPCFRVEKVKLRSSDKICILNNVQIAVCKTRLDKIILPAELIENSERRKENAEISV